MLNEPYEEPADDRDPVSQPPDSERDGNVVQLPTASGG